MATDFNSNLSALFLCDEANASDPLDHELNAYTAAIASGAPPVVTGKWAGSGARWTFNGARFNGASGESTLILNKTPQEDYTIAYWTYNNGSGGQYHPLGCWSNPLYWLFRSDGAGTNRMQFGVYTSTPTAAKYAKATTPIQFFAWQLVVGGYEASSDSIFCSVNGEPKVKTSLAGAGFKESNDMLSGFQVGATAGGTLAYNGYCDQVGMWPGWAWSDAEIAEYYNSGDGIEYPWAIAEETGRNHHFVQNFLRRRRRR